MPEIKSMYSDELICLACGANLYVMDKLDICCSRGCLSICCPVCKLIIHVRIEGSEIKIMGGQ